VAAKGLGRASLGIDTSQEFCEIARAALARERAPQLVLFETGGMGKAKGLTRGRATCS
jgi:hypothetical protein